MDELITENGELMKRYGQVQSSPSVTLSTANPTKKIRASAESRLMYFLMSQSPYIVHYVNPLALEMDI
jgi:hypothetical protein